MQIYAVTPNPALDLSGHVQGLIPNEKNYVTRPRIDPGGNGINATRIAHRLGARVLNLGFAGGAAGAELRRLLKAEKIPEKFVQIRDVTRTNVTVTNHQASPKGPTEQSRLTFPGPLVSSGEARRLLHQIQGLKAPGIFLLGGSLPLGVPGDYHAKLAAAAQHAGLGLIIDVPAKNLKRLLRSLKLRALLLKPNLAELEEFAGMRFHDENQIAAAARALNDQAALVCVSLGAEGAILVSSKNVWLARPPKTRAKGSVGAGDSMVGAMAAVLARQKLGTPEAIDRADRQAISTVFSWGLAAGAATASTEGTALAQAPLVRKLHAQMRSE